MVGKRIIADFHRSFMNHQPIYSSVTNQQGLAAVTDQLVKELDLPEVQGEMTAADNRLRIQCLLNYEIGGSVIVNSLGPGAHEHLYKGVGERFEEQFTVPDFRSWDEDHLLKRIGSHLVEGDFFSHQPNLDKIIDSLGGIRFIEEECHFFGRYPTFQESGVKSFQSALFHLMWEDSIVERAAQEIARRSED